MGFRDFKHTKTLHREAVAAGATTTQHELSSLQNAFHGANAAIRALKIGFQGSITPSTLGDIPLIDIIAAKLTQIQLRKGGENVWDLGSYAAMFLQNVRNGTGDFNGLGDTPTESVANWIEFGIRIPFLDDAFCKSMDDGLVPARALHDAQLTLTWAASTAADPFTAMQFTIEAEAYGLYGEQRPNYIMERISDKVVMTAATLRLDNLCQYHRLYVLKTPCRTADGLTSLDLTDWTISGDNLFRDHKQSWELRQEHKFTNPWINDNETVFVAADQYTDVMRNLGLPLLWPARDSFTTGESLSKAFPAFYKQLNITRGALSAGETDAPYRMLVSWLPLEDNATLKRKAAEQGLSGRAQKVRVMSKKQTVDKLGARILPSKAV